MGTQTQDQNRQQQGGNDSKSPPTHQKPAHDPVVDPDRDKDDRVTQRADKNRPQGRRADDSQPAKGEVIDEDEADEGRKDGSH